jgi:predicted phage terminase large subunit-like protein
MEQQRERLHGVLIDRLQEGGSLIAILTRWGEADLVRDFRDMGFVVIEQPLEGRYAWGRLLCPELFPDDRLQTIRDTKGSALYALTYLCDPGAASGSMVKRDWWHYFGETPKAVRHKRVHSWDLSIGKDSTADYSAFTSWAVAEDGFYLLDAGRWQLSPDDRLTKMTMLAIRDDPGYVLVEESVPSMDFIDTLKKRTRLPLVLSKPGGKDKVARLQAVLPFIETGKVFIPAKAAWVNDYLDELAAFPGGAHDDWVDSTSQALAFLKKRWGRERSDRFEEPEPTRRERRRQERQRSFAGGRW